jgi:integrase/recombinase XerD
MEREIAMKLSKACEGFLLSKSAEGLSKRTLTTYQQQLNHLTEFLQDAHIEQVTTHDLRKFFDYLRNEYTPERWGGDKQPLTGRTIHNYWICLRSFYTWAVTEFDIPDVLKPVPPPKANVAHTESYTQEEIKRILSITGERTREPKRNIALILVLLDTGIRNSELCNLRMGDLDLRLGKLAIQGKGAKKRFVYVGEKTKRALWRYLAEREENPKEFLFLTREEKQMRGIWVRTLIKRIGNKAGVRNAHPHRFRHTFAVTYLRNGGDIFTLQVLLGHSSLKMVRLYSQLADVDAANVHRRVSPVDNWL